LPVITSIREIPFEENQTFEIFYSKDKEADLNDTSFQNLSYRFMQNYSLLSTQTKQQIANNFEDAKDGVTYRYFVSVFNDFGNSPKSKSNEITVKK